MSPDAGRLIVGITGASGAIFGVRLLERLAEFPVETHVVISAWGARTLAHETGYSVSDLKGLADVLYKPTDQGAAISSGSFLTRGMVIAPCSVKTLAAIAHGYTADLITRAADVVLKERRRLVLLVREFPLSTIHLENMLALSRLGASIAPPVPGFYNKPASLEDVVDHIVTRTLDQLGLHSNRTERWSGELSNRHNDLEQTG
jgi:4-hydroxy-3-polyprenylbenzoate decarboxylase